MSTPDTPSSALAVIVVRVRDMDCAEEASLVRRALADDPGVAHLGFDLVHGHVEIAFDAALTTPTDIVAAIARTGLRATVMSADGRLSRTDDDEDRRAAAHAASDDADRAAEMRAHLPRSLLLSGLFMAVGWGADAWTAESWREALLGHAHGPDAGARPMVAALAYGLSALAGLWPMWPRALAALRYLRLDMHVLVCASALGAMAIGQWSEAAAVAFLFALAHRLEAWSIERARAAVDSLTHGGGALLDGGTRQGAPVERWIERFAAIYTPVVTGAALVVAIGPPLVDGAWATWFYRALVFLVLGCPCALVISTPVTVVAAVTAAARRGVLVKGGAPLEQAASVRRASREALARAGVRVAGPADGPEALAAADIVLTRDDPQALAFLIDHARRALGVIHQNVALAVLTKVAFLVSAVLGAAPLWLAVLADTGATVAVTLNGLRLLRAR